MYQYNKLKFCPICAGKLKRQTVEDRRRLVCSKCGYVIYHNAFPAVAIIIEKDGKIVLVKRKVAPRAGYWALPSGFIEYEESPKQTALREAFEETGFKIKIIDLVGIYFFNKFVLAHTLGPTYYAKIVSGKLKPGSDVSEAKFFNPKNLPEKFAFPAQYLAIEDWLKKYKK